MNADQIQTLGLILLAAGWLGTDLYIGWLRHRVTELETEMRRLLMRRRS